MDFHTSNPHYFCTVYVEGLLEAPHASLLLLLSLPGLVAGSSLLFLALGGGLFRLLEYSFLLPNSVNKVAEFSSCVSICRISTLIAVLQCPHLAQEGNEARKQTVTKF